MNGISFRSLFLGIVCTGIITTGHAQQLTDVVTYGTSSTGSWFGQQNVWETRSGGNYNNWIQNGSTFLNGPTDAQVQPNISLSTPGTYTFMIFGAQGVPQPRFGINLFFNGASAPSISAYGAVITNSMMPHVFAANNATQTPATVPGPNTGYNFPGAGTLSFVSGDKQITLTDFYWAAPNVFNLDMVGQTTTGPDGQLDYVGGITLQVTTIPEPQAAALLLGLAAVSRLFLRRTARE